MDFILLLAIIGIMLTIMTAACVYLVNRYRTVGYAALLGFFIMLLVISQIFAARPAEFNLYLLSFTAPTAIIAYSFTAMVNDMINEIYGERCTHLAINIALVTQVLMVILIYLASIVPPSIFFEHEAAWQDIFSLSIRIICASWISFFVCQHFDTWIFARLKEKLPKRLAVRGIVSNAMNLTLDSFIFITIAFAGVMPILPLILGQICMKNLLMLFGMPWFIAYKKKLVSGK
ncbi:MAG: queuosine precursor transporter [Methanomicrobiales archaeon]|jgi:uncharacterized integral membrane protein (TIGR00697 family)|nr:queuosine precursor transporter [Methanomicrobiales archaeon]